LIRLYHATTSVCAIKARLALAEKNLAWESELLDLRRGEQHRPEYLKLNPNGVVPTLLHDDRVLIESTLIIEYIDEAFADRPLMPNAPYERATARLWMRKIDDELHAACSALTFAIAFRPVMLRMTSEQLEAHLQRIPSPAYRERQRLSIVHGLDAPHVADAIRSHDKFIAEMEATLARSAYLAGDDYSLADAAATPYVNRAAMLGMQDLWANRPNVAGWLERMQKRASFAPAVTGWLTDADRERFAAPPDEARHKLRAILNPP